MAGTGTDSNLVSFGDVCCARGDAVGVQGTIFICDYEDMYPGVDSTYKIGVTYDRSNVVQWIKSDTVFYGAAADSFGSCAEMCEVLEACSYFTFDNRTTQARKRRFFLPTTMKMGSVCVFICMAVWWRGLRGRGSASPNPPSTPVDHVTESTLVKKKRFARYSSSAGSTRTIRIRGLLRMSAFV